MAIAVTVSDDSPSKTSKRGAVRADQTEVLATIQCDAAYPNPAAYPVDPTDFDARATEVVHIEPAWSADAASTNRLAIDRTTDPDNPVFRVFVGSTGAEVANGGNLSTAVGKFLVKATVKIPNG